MHDKAALSRLWRKKKSEYIEEGEKARLERYAAREESSDKAADSGEALPSSQGGEAASADQGPVT